MKKIALLLLLTPLLFASCEKEEPETSEEKLYGFWKLEYAKTIYPAEYDTEAGQPIYDEDAKIHEWPDGYGYPISLDILEQLPTGFGEFMIEFEQYGFVNSYSKRYSKWGNKEEYLYTTKNISGYPYHYSIENSGHIKMWDNAHVTYIEYIYQYRLEKDNLILERIRADHSPFEYAIEKYSRMKKFGKL